METQAPYLPCCAASEPVSSAEERCKILAIGQARPGRPRRALPRRRTHGHWKIITFTTGLRLDGVSAPMLLDGPVDGDAIRAYVTHALVPELTPGDN